MKLHSIRGRHEQFSLVRRNTLLLLVSVWVVRNAEFLIRGNFYADNSSITRAAFAIIRSYGFHFFLS